MIGAALLPCYRVRISRGHRAIEIIVVAADAAEAGERATVLGEDVLRKMPLLPWIDRDWPTWTSHSPEEPELVVSPAVLAHRVGLHSS